jgi:hypothetical protein
VPLGGFIAPSKVIWEIVTNEEKDQDIDSSHSMAAKVKVPMS